MNAFDLPLYGNYRQRKFTDIWPTEEEFSGDYESFQGTNTTLVANSISSDSLVALYYLLYASYGNSTIASSDENQFKYKVFSTIFMYGPAWEKRLEIQTNIRNLKLDDVIKGGKAVYNTAMNPSQPVTNGKGSSSGEGTNTLQELTYINQQNTTNYQKSLPEAYAILTDLLETDVTKEFIDRFKKLFLKFVTPELPLWYISNKEDNTDE